MTGCIVGWAHTPFGRLDGETVESLIVRVANEALADAGIEARDVDEIVLGHFNAGLLGAGFYRLAGAAGLARPALQARDARRKRLRDRIGRGASGTEGASRRRSARIVLVVGVEQMTTTPGPEIGKNLLKASYVREEADIEGGFAGIFGKIAGLYFQSWGDQSDALALIAAKNHKNGVGNPYAQLRKDLGYEFCRNDEREESVRRRAAQAHRLLAGLRRRRRARAGRRRDRAAAGQGDRVPRHRARAGLPADVQARHPQVRGLRRGLEARARPAPASRSAISRWSRRMTASPSPN